MKKFTDGKEDKKKRIHTIDEEQKKATTLG
jgi:hypothetical protein